MSKKKFNGSRLREALLYREKKITDLAEVSGITKQSLSNYVNEKNDPPYENVLKMAAALQFPPEFFMADDSVSVLTDSTYFRSQAAATKTTRKAQTVKAEYVAKLYNVLLDYVDFPMLDLPEKLFKQNDSISSVDSSEMLMQIEDLADRVRRHWKLGKGPIKSLQYALESHGIVVTSSKNVDPAIDAFSQRVRIGNGADQSYVYIIVLAVGEKPVERLRFDMAHELGHILMHPWEEIAEEIDHEAFITREKQANMFASALLLPRQAFTTDIQAYATEISHYLRLKKRWGVSIQAMMYRARQLNLITGNQFSYMMRQVSRNGWRTHEPGDAPGSINSTVFQGAIDLLFDGGYLDSHDLRVKLAEYGIILSDRDLTDLMGLKEGTILPELEETLETKSSGKILQFTIKNSNSSKE